MDGKEKLVTTGELERVNGVLLEKILQKFDDQSKDFRDFTRQEITASEKRMTSRLEQTKDEILDGVAETLSHFVYPRLDHHEQRIGNLEHKLAS